MEATVSENQKNLSALIHLSTFLKYFFPFANFFAPLLLWTFNKDKEFVNYNGQQAINFQLSLMLYILVIGLICLPIVIIFASDFISLIDIIDHSSRSIRFSEIENIGGYLLLFGLVILLLFGLFVLELYAVISATISASKGEEYKYPLSISFIKSDIQNQSNNEHTS